MNLHFNNLPDVSGGNGFEEKILFLFPEIETEFIFPGKWRKANEAKTFSLRQSLPQYGLRTAYRQEEENNANFHSLLCFSFSNKSQISFLSLSFSLPLSLSLSVFYTFPTHSVHGKAFESDDIRPPPGLFHSFHCWDGTRSTKRVSVQGKNDKWKKRRTQDLRITNL